MNQSLHQIKRPRVPLYLETDTNRGAIVLDIFGGSGSTLIAAHKTGRRAYICELDPIYCGRIIRRWEAFAKDDAELIACGTDQQALVWEGPKNITAFLGVAWLCFGKRLRLLIELIWIS